MRWYVVYFLEGISTNRRRITGWHASDSKFCCTHTYSYHGIYLFVFDTTDEKKCGTECDLISDNKELSEDAGVELEIL